MYKDRKLADKPEIEANKPTEDKWTVIINGKEKITLKRELTFEDVVALKYDNRPPEGENVRFSISYKFAGGENRQLLENEKVQIKKGMVFRVTKTDNS